MEQRWRFDQPFRHRRRSVRAFTLVEVLIAIAVLSVLLGMLIPTLAAARRTARSAVCQANERNLIMGVAAWTADRKGSLPGPNSTGLAFRGKVTDILKMTGDTTSTTPTSTFDWISPVMGDALRLSTNRAERTWQIFDRLACPESRTMNTRMWPPGARTLPDFDDFKRVFIKRGFRQISYLASAPFLYRGPGYSRYKFETYPFAGPAVVPDFYIPQMDKVGASPSRKIFFADGTRYLASKNTLDFDLSPKPEYYGSFTSSSPIYEGSTAYGRAKAGAGFDAVRAGSRRMYPANRNLSYRHNGAMNAAFFDGHVASLDEKASKRDASLWYPTGSLFTGKNATPESIKTHADEKILH